MVEDLKCTVFCHCICQVQVLSNGDSMNMGNLADKEKIQLLEQQITVWSEDFNQERSDIQKCLLFNKDRKCVE